MQGTTTYCEPPTQYYQKSGLSMVHTVLCKEGGYNGCKPCVPGKAMKTTALYSMLKPETREE